MDDKLKKVREQLDEAFYRLQASRDRQQKRTAARNARKAKKEGHKPSPQDEHVLSQPSPTPPPKLKKKLDIEDLMCEWQISRWVLFLDGVGAYKTPEDANATIFGAKALVSAVKEIYPRFTRTDLETAITIRLIARIWKNITKKSLTSKNLKDLRSKVSEGLVPHLKNWKQVKVKIFGLIITVGKDLPHD